MNIRILEKKEAPLFSRMEVKAQLKFSGATPSTKEITKALAKNLSADEKTIVIREISTKFGFREAKAIAHIYKKEEDMNLIEPAHFFKSEKAKEKKEAETTVEESKSKETPKEKVNIVEESKSEEIKSEEKSV